MIHVSRPIAADHVYVTGPPRDQTRQALRDAV